MGECEIIFSLEQSELCNVRFDRSINVFQLLLYAEGTRFTPEKHVASQKFAKEKGLPVLNHHLTPRTKGFTASIPHMRGKVEAIYNVQLAFKPNEPVKPTMTNLLYGKKVEAHMYLKRIPLSEVPDGEAAASEWLHRIYQQKVYSLSTQLSTDRLNDK